MTGAHGIPSSRFRRVGQNLQRASQNCALAGSRRRRTIAKAVCLAFGSFALNRESEGFRPGT